MWAGYTFPVPMLSLCTEVPDPFKGKRKGREMEDESRSEGKKTLSYNL
jgi:hypothetical protein